MWKSVVLLGYNLVLPVVAVLVAWGWIRKMADRGGLSAKLWERLGFFDEDEEWEPCGGVYVHAVSVGEVLMAVKLIERWRERDPKETFVLAATTSTGFELAREKAPAGVRVIYSVVDFPWLVGKVMRRFQPRLLLLLESELWPNLLRAAEKRNVPVMLVNARLSARSAGRYRKLGAVAKPVLGMLSKVLAQEEEHAKLWNEVGVPMDRVVVTGSVKFDQEGVAPPKKREQYSTMIEAFGRGRPVVIAASTFPGEEVAIAKALRGRPEVLPVLVPRHGERREQVRKDLEAAGFEVVLRSHYVSPRSPAKAVLVVDSTGELRDWTAEADVVVVGKSFLAKGGQNPTEAIAVGIPVVCGRFMGNFEPLISELRESGGVRTCLMKEVGDTVGELLDNSKKRREMVEVASTVLTRHWGAMGRTLGEFKISD
jgi:3-deoxy-D-manno-octulosonic-acid transferase